MKNILFIIFACFTSFSFAQILQEEKIPLSELEMPISGENSTSIESAPDFSKVVPPAGQEKNITPKLPSQRISYENEETEEEADFFSGENKNIYAKGIVGGGFPGDFIGDFSVYKSSNIDPFRIEFSHFSRNGYGKHSAADGYFDNGTKIYAEKSFRIANSDLTFGGRYDRAGTGLQKISDHFYDMISQKVSGVFLFDYFFGDSGFEFFSETESYWYNRYSGITTDGDFLKQERNINVFWMEPGFIFSWYNKGFSAGLECNFQVESFLGKHDYANVDELFRVDATLFTGYESDIVTAFTRGGIAGGTKIGEGRTIVPSFITGAEVRVPFSNGNSLVVGANGGLETRHEEFSVLERKYKFAQMTTLTEETSDWFVNSKIVLPLFELISFNSSLEFKKTAFDNYLIEADYSTKKTCGVFGFKAEDRTQVTTDNGVSIKYNIFTLRGGWRAHWNYVPSNEYRHSVDASIAFDDEYKRFGFSAGVIESVDKKSDKLPNLYSNFYLNIKKSIKLSLEVNDAIKLFAQKDREYVESGYLVRAGSVTFLTSFSF